MREETQAEAAQPTAVSFDELYTNRRIGLFRALTTITGDRDLATEAIDAGFTSWRRRLRKPRGIPGDVGVMAYALKRARRELGKTFRQLSGFRLSDPKAELDTAAWERFQALSLDERGLLVMRTVLGWNDEEIGHALAADGVTAAGRSLGARLERDGYDIERMTKMVTTHAAGFTAPLSRLETVKAKGALQKAAAFAGAALATASMIGGGVAVFGALGSPEAPAGAAGPAAANAAGPLTTENAVWERLPHPVTSGEPVAVTHDGTDFYLLSNDFDSRGGGRAVVLRSSDGRDWIQIPGPGGDGESWFRHIVATPDVLVVVGNGFNERRGQETPLVYVSTDRAAWTRVDLPAVDSVEVAGRSVTLHTWIESATATDSGFTIVAHQSAELDPAELLRDVVDPELFQHGFGIDSSGIQFVAPNGEVLETMTWEELGLEQAAAELLAGKSATWISEDGLQWETVAGSAPPGGHGGGTVVALTGVEAALVYGEFAPTLWLRRDGDWERADLEATIFTITSWKDRLIAAGSSRVDGRSALWSTPDGVTWQQTEFPAGGIQQFHSSAGGIVGIGWGGFASVLPEPATLEVDGLTVTVTIDGLFQVRDGEGTLIVETFGEDLRRGEMITITDPETGEVIVEFDESALEQAMEDLVREPGFGIGNEPRASVAFSTDGIEWSVLEMDDDDDFYPQSVAIGNNSILLAGWEEGGGFLGFGGQGRPGLVLVHPE